MTRTGVVPWPASYVERYRVAGFWRSESLGSWPRDWAERHGARTAVVDGATRLSYPALARRVDTLAAGLRRIGLAGGDNIVIQLPNCWQFVVLFLACQRIGVAPALALPQHRDQELGHIAQRVGARAVAVPATWRDYDHQALAARVVDRLAEPAAVLVLGDPVAPGNLDLGDLLARPDPDPLDPDELAAGMPDPQDAAFFLLSGGTTGSPKIIARTHDDYSYSVRGSAESCDYDSRTVFLAALPMAHGLTLGGPGVLGVLSVGGRLVIAPSPNPATAFALISDERVTTTALTPAVALRWLEAAGTSDADLSSLSVLQVAGAQLPLDTARRITPVLGCRLQQVFGMSEGLHCYTRAGDPPEVVLHTQGRPISPADELLVVDGSGCPVPPGTSGELLVRGPTTIRGYFDDPDADAVSFTPDGWYRTGDLVRLDDRGNVTVTGRLKDVVNRGGEKISAEEVERSLRTLLGIAHPSVVAVPDPRWGERVCACVVVRPGHSVKLAEVRHACARSGLAAFKAPEQLECFDELPLTAVGKVDKKVLRELVLARAARTNDGRDPAGDGQLTPSGDTVAEPFSDADLLRIIIHGTSAFELLRTGLEFDLFEKLADAGGMTLAATAAAIGVAEQPARILLMGLTSLRLLRKDGEVYHNADITRRKLLRSSPRYVGPLVDVQAEIINPAIGDFAESMRQNTNVGLRSLTGPGDTLYERLTAHPRLQTVYYSNMGDASRKSFPLVLDRFDFGPLRHVLDVGGGDGSNATALATRFPHLKVTVFDQDTVVRIAAERAVRADVADRVSVAPGDIFDDPFPDGVDAIMLFHLFEIWSLARNTKLLRKCYDALPDGGVVLLYTFVSDDDNTGPLSAALVSPYFLTLASGEGMTYSAKDMEDAAREAGFRRIRRHPDMGFNHALVAAYK